MQIKRQGIFFLCAAALAIFSAPLLYGQTDWQEYKTNHFVIYYHKNMAKDYVEQVATQAENYYSNIAVNLGLTRYDAWLWDNRAKIYIFKDGEEYRKESAQPAWSDGSVSMRRKIIKTYPWAEGFFDKLLPHELGHIMFREFVGFKNNIPLWLDEGIAILQERADIKSYSISMKRLLKRAVPIPIDKLNKITGSTLILPEIFYAQSASIIDYLTTQFRKDYLIRFFQCLKKGKNLDEALAYAYNFKNVKELSEAWIEYLKSLKEDN